MWDSNRQANQASHYVSVNSKPDHPRATPGDSHVLTAQGVRASPKFLCLWGQNFELEKFSTVLKENCRNFSICFKEIRGSLKNRYSYAISYEFAFCIFNNIDHFRSFLFMLDHHQNFECLIWKGLSLTFSMFQGYSLGYS